MLKEFGRNGRIGRRFVWNTIPKRELYLSFKRLINLSEIKGRENLAKTFKETEPIDPKMGLHSNSKIQIKLSALDELLAPELAKLNQTAQSLGGTKKQLLSGNLLEMSDDRFTNLLNLVLSDELIRKVSEYLEVVPLLTNVDLWLSRFSEESSSSQLYHIDWEDSRQLKMFVNFSDVDESNGPFTAVSRSKTEEIVKKLDFKFLGDYYLKDERVKDLISEDDKHVVTGKKGAVSFADTSACLHYGSRIRNRETTRIVLMLQFLRPQSFFFDWNFQHVAPYQKYVTSKMTELQKLVLGNSKN